MSVHMGIKDFFIKETTKTNDRPILQTVQPTQLPTDINEALQGLVTVKKINFPKELGEEHPFEYQHIDKLCKRFGILNAIIDKHVDFMLAGGIIPKCEDTRALEIIQNFHRDYDFLNVVRVWFAQAFRKGFSPLELGISDEFGVDGLKVLKADHIFVDRTDTGEIEGYNQYLKPFKTFNKAKNMKEVESFEPYEIAALNFNVWDDEFYGYGLIYPALLAINNLLGSNKEMHTLMRRKANNPLFFIMGNKEKDQFPTQGEMDALGNKLEWLNNKQEWVLTDFVKPTTLDFGNLGDKFSFILENDMQVLLDTVQIPQVLMGPASISEGIADVRMEAFKLRIQSYRELAEKIIEEQIYKPILQANGLDVHVEIEWGLPTPEEKNARATVYLQALQLFDLNPGLRAEIEKKFAEVMDISEEDIQTSDEERNKEADEKQPRVPGQNANPPSSQPSKNPSRKECTQNIYNKAPAHIHESYTTAELEVLDNMTVQEFVNFNYKSYLENILDVIETDKFEALLAANKIELDAGKLTKLEIKKVRSILTQGMENNLSIRDIKMQLDEEINFKDRYQLDKEGKLRTTQSGEKILAVPAKARAIGVARTEVVRVSNLGAERSYAQNGILEERWVATLSERTCPECEALNGVIFKVGEGILPPLHGLCRCSIAPVVKD